MIEASNLFHAFRARDHVFESHRITSRENILWVSAVVVFVVCHEFTASKTAFLYARSRSLQIIALPRQTVLAKSTRTLNSVSSATVFSPLIANVHAPSFSTAVYECAYPGASSRGTSTRRPGIRDTSSAIALRAAVAFAHSTLARSRWRRRSWM